MRLSLTGLERLFNEKAKKNLLQNFQRKRKKKTFFQAIKSIELISISPLGNDKVF